MPEDSWFGNNMMPMVRTVPLTFGMYFGSRLAFVAFPSRSSERICVRQTSKSPVPLEEAIVPDTLELCGGTCSRKCLMRVLAGTHSYTFSRDGHCRTHRK